MLSILFIACAITVFIIAFVMICVLTSSRHTDERITGHDSEKAAEEMFWKNQICTMCKTGKDSYELDTHSEICPYIGCWENGSCRFYVPLEPDSKSE